MMPWRCLGTQKLEVPIPIPGPFSSGFCYINHKSASKRGKSLCRYARLGVAVVSWSRNFRFWNPFQDLLWVCVTYFCICMSLWYYFDVDLMRFTRLFGIQRVYLKCIFWNNLSNFHSFSRYQMGCQSPMHIFATHKMTWKKVSVKAHNCFGRIFQSSTLHSGFFSHFLLKLRNAI